eukprot:TRINITY_DN14380_c0_g1_i1.p1 TRINITY_DN14380_c0_g1~~TRINITY_DN14380_c0_g1_i1.p1  ORF type:complete len:374 (+),score=43.27 TRINITY_DN14380_c0_g1_i1:46-1167(+)
MRALVAIIALIVAQGHAAEIDGRIANVEEVTEGIEAFLGSRNNVLLTVYAPWCEYSKAMVGVLRSIGEIVNSDALAKSRLSIAKLDGNFYGTDAVALQVNSYPQVVLFKNGIPKLYSGPKVLSQILHFINSEMGLDLQPKTNTKTKDIQIVTDDTIDSFINGGNFVVLQILSRTSRVAQEVAGWYQTLTQTYSNEPSITITAMEAERNPVSSKKYKVDPATPKIIIFHKGRQYPFGEPELSPGSLVYFINKVAGTNRNLDGSLNTKAGRVPELHSAVKGNAFKAPLLKSALAKAEEMSQNNPTDKDIALYLRVLKKVNEKGATWVTTEISRLAGLVHANSVSEDKIDLFTKRLNILNSMLPMESDDDNHHEEL